MRKMEEVAIATALRNVLSPRLQATEDLSLVATFVVDLWPDADVDFGLDEEAQGDGNSGKVGVRCCLISRVFLFLQRHHY